VCKNTFKILATLAMLRVLEGNLLHCSGHLGLNALHPGRVAAAQPKASVPEIQEKCLNVFY
jgi:hypothetical protein